MEKLSFLRIDLFKTTLRYNFAIPYPCVPNYNEYDKITLDKCYVFMVNMQAIRVEYDPNVLSYQQILEKFFDMQGGPPAYGSFSRQYRSAILYHNDEQKAVVGSLFNKYAKETGKHFSRQCGILV